MRRAVSDGWEGPLTSNGRAVRGRRAPLGESPSTRERRPAPLVVLALTLAACSGGGSKAPPAGLGRPVFSGAARNLAASPDGASLAFLDGCREVKGQFLPPRTASCDLRVVASAGGAARRIAGAVTTLPQGVLWSPVSSGRAALAALSEYDYPTASGSLVLWRGEEPRELARDVTFHGFAPGGGALLAVSRGRLLAAKLAGDVSGDPGPLPDLDGVASVAANPRAPALAGPGAVVLLARRTAQAGGSLVALWAETNRAEPVAPHVGDYRFAPSGDAFAFTARAGAGYELRLAVGARRTTSLGKDVRDFGFSADGRAVAWLADATPGKQGDLHAAPVMKGAERVLARDVGEFRWAAKAPRLVWLERYDPRVRGGTVGAGGLDAPPRTFAANVTDVEISADGEHVAFLQHTTRGGYSVDLGLAHLAGPGEPPFQTVARGVFGFAFSPDARWLYYRTRCTRNAEACDLERVPAAGPAPGGKPELVAQAAKSFEFDPRDPERLLVTWQRTDRDALDVGVWQNGKVTTVDTYVLPGSAQLLGPDSRRLAYVVVHEKRAGVYVAELPR